MRLVVADTGPLNYLILIGQIELLPILFEQIYAPKAVQAELRHADAPEAVRRWIAKPLGVLDLAARRGLVRMDDALERLKVTSFRCRPDIIEALLASHAKTSGAGNLTK